MAHSIRLGFIGCGKHATRGHALNALELPDLFSITSAYDVNQNALVRFCEMASTIEAAESAEGVIENPEVDAVIIATPHEFHLDLMRKAVDAGKHVLCEKPLWVGNHTSDAQDIIAGAHAKNLVFTSCHVRRCAPEFLYVRENLPRFREQLGALLEFNFRFFYHEPSTAWKRAEDESLLLDHLNHEVDLLHFLLGHAPLTLERKNDAFDIYEVTGERDDGVRIFFLGTRRLKNRVFRNELELVFEKGRVFVVATLENGMVRATITTSDFDSGDGSLMEIPEYSYEDVLTRIMRNFGEAIGGRVVNYLDATDLIVNNEACNELLENGVYRYEPKSR